MLEVDCKLLQSVHLGRIFTVTPVWMGDNIVKLYIVARDGGELTIVEQALPTAGEAELQQQEEEQQNAQSSSDSQPLNEPSDDSEPVH
ncbi:MAG: hypothetical protein K0U59_08000 [Gammaproteobacteria bacterium]|nr:hypothetical protein [Gammaproteobacteria bacterium]